MLRFLARGFERQRRFLMFYKKLKKKEKEQKNRLNEIAQLLLEAQIQIVKNQRYGIAVTAIECALVEVKKWELEISENS